VCARVQRPGDPGTAGEKYLAAHEKITVRLGTVRMDVRASASIGSFRENASPSLYDIFGRRQVGCEPSSVAAPQGPQGHRSPACISAIRQRRARLFVGMQRPGNALEGRDFRDEA